MKTIVLALTFLALFFSNTSFAHGSADECGSLFGTELTSQEKEFEALSEKLRDFTDENGYVRPEARRFLRSREFIENSIEVVYFDTTLYGHSFLRVGHKRISFDWPGKAKFETIEFFGPKVRDGQISAVIMVPKNKIRQVLPEIEKIMVSSKEYNIPPIDTLGLTARIYKNANGYWQVESKNPRPIEAALPKLAGSVYLDVPQPYVQSFNGVKRPIFEKEGSYYLQTYSCSSGAAYILKTFFSVKIESYNALMIGGQIAEGLIGPIVDYARVFK